MRKRNTFKLKSTGDISFKREPCLCCECKYWSAYIDQHELNGGRCLKGKSAFPEMQKCEDFDC